MEHNPRDLSHPDQERKPNGVDIAFFEEEAHSGTQIASMHLQIRQWQEYAGENTYSNIEDSQEDLGDIPANYIEAGGQFLIAHSAEGEVVGFVGLQQKEAGKGVLKRLAVMTDFRGRGIGNALVEQLIAWAKSNDYESISLSTGEKERAKPIYLRHGFQITGYDQKSRDFLMHLNL